MIKIDQKNYSGFISWAERCTCGRVYSLSIARNIQSGDIFADDLHDPGTVLFWHCCGFAYIAGSGSEDFLEELVFEIPRGSTRRLALITDDACTIRFLRERGFETSGRVEYVYAGDPGPDLFPDGAEISRIDETNIRQITGRIVPSFSWEKESFLRKGFGYAAFVDGTYAGTAFSSAVSLSEVDIGVEVRPEYRGRGIASALARRMCGEITAGGRKPVWAHAESNTASMKTALKCGFIRRKTNCFCLISK